MKTALIQIHCEALARILGLPDGARVDAAYQRPEDLASDSFTFRIRGVGREEPEGNQFRYYGLDEVCEGPKPGPRPEGQMR